MLRVPDLRPGEEPFDPQRVYPAHSMLRSAGHTLGAGTGSFPAGTGLLGGTPSTAPTPEGRPAVREEKPEELVFDEAMVRNVLTDLHERGESLGQRQAESPGEKAAGIVRETESFLTEQRADLRRRLTSDRQRAMFEFGFQAYCRTARARAEALQNRRIRQFQAEVTRRQNSGFLRQALHPDTVFDDAAQNMLRTMYLRNSENLYFDFPAAERRIRTDAADAEFCRGVLERRLELDPARMRSLLDSAAVCRLLGPEEAAVWEEKAAQALRADAVRRAAGEWAAEGLSPGEAEAEAEKAFPEAAERQAALKDFRELRRKADLHTVLGNLEQLQEIWEAVTAEGASGAERLTALRHTDPEAAERLREAADERARNGGAPARPDWGHLLRLTDRFDPGRAAAELTDPAALFQLHRSLGGPGAPAFDCYLRMLIGTAEDSDTAFLDSLRQAREAAAAARAGSVPPAELTEFLHRYSEKCRIFRERNAYAELEYAEQADLAQQTLRDMGWTEERAGRNGGGEERQPAPEKAETDTGQE